jgi:hypothetical protein
MGKILRINLFDASLIDIEQILNQGEIFGTNEEISFFI